MPNSTDVPDVPQQPAQKRRRWLTPVLVVGALMAGVGVGSASQTEPEVQTVTETPTETDEEAAVTTTETTFEDGMHLVGSDIAPGTYRSEDGNCYWERLSGTSGEFDDIIANGNGPSVVTVAESDVAFHTQMCGTWTAVQ